MNTTTNDAICDLMAENGNMKEEISRLERTVSNAMWELSHRSLDCPGCYHDTDEDFAIIGCTDDCTAPDNEQIATCWRRWLEREVCPHTLMVARCEDV